MKNLVLEVKRLSENAQLPIMATPGSAGYDLSSAHSCVIPPRQRMLCKTDIAVCIPEGCYGRVAPRSGLALKYGIDVGAGVIDRDYIGNLGVVLFNNSDQSFTVEAGMRVAQLILEQHLQVPVVEMEDELPTTDRGEGGFGSTGLAI